MNKTTVRVKYSNGNEIISSINLSIEEASRYYKSFNRIEENFETGEETISHCVSVEEIV